MDPIFTVDLEDWNHAIHIHKNGHSSFNNLFTLLAMLENNNVKALFYILGRFEDEHQGITSFIHEKGHDIGSHGFYHDHDEKSPFPIMIPYRSPYWDTTPMPFPPSGGVFFRFMPLWYIKWALKKSGVFWLHLHDLDKEHPKLKNPIMNWKRHVGLKTARAKLERLLREVKWGAASL